MTNPNRRHVSVVLDRSGSMTFVKADTEGGLRDFLATQADAPGDTTVSLHQFDHGYDTVYERVPLADVPAYVLHPRGWTALHDAIGITVTRLGEHLASLPDDERPGEVIVVILTDGDENHSKEYNGAQIKAMITQQREEYGWVFVFLGADQDAVTVAGNLGIRAETSLAYGSAHTSAAMKSAGDAVTRGSMSGTYGFTDEERAASS